LSEEQGVARSSILKDALIQASENPDVDTFRHLARVAFPNRVVRDGLSQVLKEWSSTASSFANKANAALLEGYCRFLAGEYQASQEILGKDLKNPWSAYYHVRCLLARQRIEESLSAVESAHKKHKDFAPLTFLAIEVYCRGGWEDQVPALLESLQSSYRDTSEFAFHQGLYFEKTSEYKEAIAYYRRAVDLNHANTMAWFRLGFCLDLYGDGGDDDLDEAIAAYEKCLKVVPPHTNAIINLGVLYEDRERYHDAIKCYETVLRYYPNHARARLFLEDARASTRMFYDRDEEKKADRQSQVLKIPVTDFELSVRSRNCLQKMNILTLGDLIMKSEQELLSYKNFGETSLKEIKDMLASKGLRLGQGLEQRGQDPSSPRNPLEATAEPGVLNKAIDELQLSVRSRRCMERLGIKMVRDLINMTEVQLMSAKNFGMTSLNEIKRKLAEMGLRLRG
jgi:DNA-directed RNA polymerase subunit alpha